MTTLRYLWFALSALFYPVFYLLYLVHRLLVFSSKAGARWIVPMLMLALGLLLRTHIDAFAGETITDLYANTPGPVFSWRMEITFALLFLALFLALRFVSVVTAPIVGALPAPRPPLAPIRPLTVKAHVISAERARLAVKPVARGSFRGDLRKLERSLPASVRALLQAEPAPSPATAAPTVSSSPPSGFDAAPSQTPSPHVNPPAPPPTRPSAPTSGGGSSADRPMQDPPPSAAPRPFAPPPSRGGRPEPGR